jgi:integrase
VALAAVHAARPAQIRALQLSDADLGNRRLTIAGKTRPLDDLSPLPQVHQQVPACCTVHAPSG